MNGQPQNQSFGGVVQGKLKKIKSFWSSSTDFYKLEGQNLCIASKVNGKFNFQPLYDMNLYGVQISPQNKLKFFLVPKVEQLSLTSVTFQVKSAEDRARWFMALSKACGDDSRIDINGNITNRQDSQMLFENENDEDQIEEMTLSEISNFLQLHIKTMQEQIAYSKSLFLKLRVQIGAIPSEQTNPQTNQTNRKQSVKNGIGSNISWIQAALNVVEDNVSQQGQIQNQMVLIAQRLHNIAEQVGIKQMQTDPQGFMKREIVQPAKLKASQRQTMTSKDSKLPKDWNKNGLLIYATENDEEDVRCEEFKSGGTGGNQNMEFQYNYEELDSSGDFHDAVENIHSNSFVASQRQIMTQRFTTPGFGQSNNQKDDDEDPPERDQLPFLKDPNAKVSFWAIIKDSIGKDITQMQVPVYFNDPTSLLQKWGLCFEYSSLLTDASHEPDPFRRLALIAVHHVSGWTNIERTATKPFNPILGETYELVTEDFEMINEQVSHHPPVGACHVRGRKGDWRYWTNGKTDSKFTGKNLLFIQAFLTYIEMQGELYEITNPPISAHNLVIGDLYLDIGDKATIVSVTNPNVGCELQFFRRGWFSKEEFKVTGQVYEIVNGKKQTKYEINGNWNSQLSISKPDSRPEVVWKKNPYPDMWAHMYGLSHFGLQLNYFPKQMGKIIPPTDTRRRPDQRALENGDIKTASYQKDRLENIQRAQRKWHVANQTKHIPAYFEPELNKRDDQIYFVYKKNYFEKERKQQKWGHLTPIFPERIPDHLIQHMPKKFDF